MTWSERMKVQLKNLNVMSFMFQTYFHSPMVMLKVHAGSESEGRRWV